MLLTDKQNNSLVHSQEMCNLMCKLSVLSSGGFLFTGSEWCLFRLGHPGIVKIVSMKLYIQ